MDERDLYSRLEWLEELSVFQERTVEMLNEALVAQQRQLDEQELRLKLIEEKCRELWMQTARDGGESTVPPHYAML